MIPASTTEGLYIAEQVHQCWAGSQIRQIEDGRGDITLYRVMTPRALATVHTLPGYWQEIEPPTAELTTETPQNDVWQAYQPRGINVAPNGDVAVVEATTESVLFFNPQGKIQSVLKGLFIYPSVPAYLPDGDLVVADAGTGIFIFDSKSQIRSQITSVASPRGIFITPQSEIYVAEAGGGRITVFNEAGDLVRTYQGGDNFPQPTSVAVSKDGLIAVGDPVVGKITILDQDQKILNVMPISQGDSSDAKPGLLWLANGNLLYTDAVQGVLRLIDPKGKVLKEWTGLQRPNGLALKADGMVYLLEAGANRIVTITLP
jgi:streptogramin lyase